LKQTIKKCSDKMKNVVIVVQRFSPYEKVGARRWSKIVHYLQSYEDINITVITQKYNGLSVNPWNIDLDKKKVKVIYLSEKFDNLKNMFPFLKRVSVFLKFKVLGHTDEGYGFSKKAFSFLNSNSAELNPDLVIASSPAYSTCYFSALYKKKNSEVKLINDYRDAWIDGFFSWNKNLTEADKIYKKQKKMELFSLNNCDAVVSVTPELVQKFKGKITDTSINCHLFTNGYDKRDLPVSIPEYPKEFKKENINICHFGTLDFGREDEFLKFVSDLDPNEKIVFYLIGRLSEKLRGAISSLKNVIHIPSLEPLLLKPFLYHSDLHLVVNDREFYYAYGSKIFDAMLYSKPVIFISKENSLIQRCKNDSFFLHSDNSSECNKKVINLVSQKKYLNSGKLDYNEFDMKYIAEKYYTMIKAQMN